LNIRLHLDAPPDRGAAHRPPGRRLRPLLALLGLTLIVIAELFGIASSPVEQPDVSILLSCASCHD
jgi:hypothetical protein